MTALFGAVEQRAFLPSTIVTERSARFLSNSELVSGCKSQRTTLKFPWFLESCTLMLFGLIHPLVKFSAGLKWSHTRLAVSLRNIDIGR